MNTFVLMRNTHFYAGCLGALLLSGCATVSQKEVFDAVGSVSAKENLVWIKTQSEADSVNASVNSLLSKPLTQDNAVRIALINNRSLQQTYEEIGISQSELVQAGLMSNPLLGYSVGKSGGITTTTWSLDVMFLDLLWIPLRRELGGLTLEETKYRVGDEVLKMARDTKIAYIDAKAAYEKIKLYDAVLKSYEASVQLAIRQNTAGNSSRRDFLKIHDAYAYARLESMKLGREYAMARENLNRILGVYGDQTQFELTKEPLELTVFSTDEKGLENRAIVNRLDMNAAIAKVDYTAAQAGYAKNTRLLSEIELSAESEKTTDENKFNTFGIKIPIPIFDFGQARVSQAQALYNQSVHRLYETAVNVRSQVREGYASTRYSYDMAREMKDVVVPANEQILGETQKYYNGMLDGIYELLEDQRRLGETKIQALEALGEHQKAQANLEYILGGDINATK
jgi:outer membrane protein TolC